MTRNKRQRGFSMVEVLVALAILAVGMMGIGALFVSGLQLSGGAILRTRAVNLSEDMADRIRANPAGAAGYVAAVADTGTNNGCEDVGGGASGQAYVAATVCTAAQLAAHDIFSWKQAVSGAASGLPGGQASIARNVAGTLATYTIQIQWTERNENLTHITVFQAQ